ncbi:hypothetical protein [Paraburkholderia ferrariae]
MTTAIVVLFGFEALAPPMLFGAQMIAEYERLYTRGAPAAESMEAG